MYIRVVDDIFDISNRIKDIDDGYFVVFNKTAARFEVHNSKQKDTFCISCPRLNGLVLKKLHETKIVNIDRILSEIDENNQKIAEKSQKNSIDEAKESLGEIMQSLNSGKNYNPKCTQNKWR